MENQPVPTECFEDAFLDFLRVRFEFEPLPHYVMAAMHLCDESGRSYPPFVHAFFTWFASSFLFGERRGRFPAQSHNADPSDARWRRFADCHDLLEGWLNDDLTEALERQERRIQLVEEVEIGRSEKRDDPPGKAGRRRAMSTKTQAEVFEELQKEMGIAAHTLQRQYKKMTEPKQFMSSLAPIAFVQTDGKYHTEFRQVGSLRETDLPAGKTLR